MGREIFKNPQWGPLLSVPKCKVTVIHVAKTQNWGDVNDLALQ